MLTQLSGALLEQVLDGIGTPTFVVSVAGPDRFVVLYSNKALQVATGLSSERVRNQWPSEVVPPEQAEALNRHYRQCSQTGEPVSFQTQLTLPIGERWLRITLSPVRDETGTVARILGTMFDETEELLTQQTLRFQHLLLKAQQELSPDGIVIVGVDGTIHSWNARFLHMWNVAEEVLRAGRHLLYPFILAQLVDPDGFYERVEGSYNNLQEDILGEEFELKNGKVYQLYSRGLVGENDLGHGRIWFLRDVTESRVFQRRLSESLALQNAILDSAYQIILSVDEHLVFRSFNAAAERLLGYKAEELIGRETALILHDPVEVEERRAAKSRELGQNLSIFELLQGEVLKGRPSISEWTYLGKDGTRIPVELSLTRLHDERDNHLGFLAIATDITERKEIEQRLFELATTDGLTRLWNRRYFTEQAGHSLSRASRYDENLCVALIDIDYFKRVNDTYGHAAGDTVLYQVAQTLNQMLRKSDFMCRWGGEEFAALLVNTEPNEALQVAERMRRAVMQLAIEHEGTKISATISIGLSNQEASEEVLDAIMSRADQALYAAKTAGRNCVQAVWTAGALARHEAAPTQH